MSTLEETADELRALRTELWDIVRGFDLKTPPKDNGSDDSRLIWAFGNIAIEHEKMIDRNIDRYTI